MGQIVQMLTWDDCAVQGCESTHSPRGHEDLFYASLGEWNLKQRILTVHGDTQQVADCLTKIKTPRAAHRKALGL